MLGLRILPAGSMWQSDRAVAAYMSVQGIEPRGASLMNDAIRSSMEVDSNGRTVRELLANRKYSIDYYEREYKCQRKQVAKLLDDHLKQGNHSDRRTGIPPDSCAC